MNRGLLALALGLAAPLASAQGCVMTVPMNLEALVDGAERIAVGECVSAETRTVSLAGGEIAATRYTFTLEEGIRGATGETLSFEQFGAPGSLAGLPVFMPGERYLLLISAPGAPGGLTSTVGLDQGAFRFVPDEETGGARLLNGRDNAELFSGLTPAAEAITGRLRASTAPPADELLGAVRALAGRAQ